MINSSTPNRKNTSVVIITFNPDERLRRSIDFLFTCFENIIIVDNCSSINFSSYLNRNDIKIFRNQRNLGIAEALNIGADYSCVKGYKWLLMLDQDTIPIVDLLEIYKIVYLSYPQKEFIGQIGVSYIPQKDNEIKYKIVSTLITSGTLLSLDVYKVAGSFRKDFFIDSVDFEYSLRIRKFGFVNIKSPVVALDHRIGNEKQIKFFFLTVKSTNHNLERRYYMARNHVIITKRYFLRFPLWIIKKNFYFIKSIFQILLVEKNVKPKLQNIILGLKDGFSFKGEK